MIDEKEFLKISKYLDLKTEIKELWHKPASGHHSGYWHTRCSPKNAWITLRTSEYWQNHYWSNSKKILLGSAHIIHKY